FFIPAENGIRDPLVTGVQTCALPIWFISICFENVGDAQSTPWHLVSGTRRYQPADIDVDSPSPDTGYSIGASEIDPYTHVLKIRSEERRVGKECDTQSVKMW